MTATPGATQFHAMTAEEAADQLHVRVERGLAPDDVSERLARHGENRLPEPRRPSALSRLLAQFADPLVGALLVAAVVALLVASTGADGGSWVDAIAIAAIVALNAALGFGQERRAQAALDALRRMSAPHARVLRDGEVHEVGAEMLVPGDVIELHAGDAVPADARLLSTTSFEVEESALTGESTTVHKDAAAVLPADAPTADQTNMALTGTTVTRGEARAVVVHTGADTELGRIGAMLREIERQPTPLERRLAGLGKAILVACLVVSAVVFGIGLLKGTAGVAMLLLVAVSLAVAAIPEGLPAITTITLALGMQRMARRGAIVRKLPAVETLGSATVICADKTGTLTQNAMTVRVVWTLGETYQASGEGYGPGGSITRGDQPLDALPAPLEELLVTGMLCNDAHLEVDEGEGTRAVGDPTEAALLVLARKGGIDRNALSGSRVASKVPFDSDRKRMSLIVHPPDGPATAHVKGSPEAIVSRCSRVRTADGTMSLDEETRGRILAQSAEHADRALRVLALARGDDPNPDDPERDLTFLGLVAMHDPPRTGAAEAIAACRSAGIRVIMITGDHPSTAQAVASDLDIHREGDRTLTGVDLAVLDDDELTEAVGETTVYARVTPAQKHRIVVGLQRRGNVVAMTGDGVNDAPALEQAAIGVAMGRTGTDVARSAAEMVLADDDFSTIVAAIREGRAIFENIHKFIFFLGSSNAGLVVAVLAASLLDLPQLTPLSLLWINLVTNGLPALALGVDPPDASQMSSPPRPHDAGIVGFRDLLGVLLVGAVMGGAALSMYALPSLAPELFSSTDPAARMLEARTMAFSLLAFSPLIHAHNCRSPIASVFSVGLFSNRFLWLAVGVSAAVQLLAVAVPALHPVFHTHAMTAGQWMIVLALSALPLPIVEILKAADRVRLRSTA